MNRYPADLVRAQTRAILEAWSMSPGHAQTTASLMTETDLRGVDSHGISMLPSYEKQIATGQVRPRSEFTVVRESAATALIDADSGFGHAHAIVLDDEGFWSGAADPRARVGSVAGG